MITLCEMVHLNGGGHVAIGLVAAALLGLIGSQKLHGLTSPISLSGKRLASPAAKAHERLHSAAMLRLQQQQKLELREEERDFGAGIETPGGAKIQELAEMSHDHGANFEAMKAAGEARTQSLADLGVDSFDEGIHEVEQKYRELLGQRDQMTKLKEHEVRAIYMKEMKKLVADGKEEDARLRRDEENAETTILAEQKEEQIKKKLLEVKQAANIKVEKLRHQLQSAQTLAEKYAQEAGQKVEPMTSHLEDKTATDDDLLKKYFAQSLEKITDDVDHHEDRKQKDTAKQSEKDQKVAREKEHVRKEQEAKAKAKRQAEEAAAAKEKAAQAKAAQEKAAKAKAAKEKLAKERAAAAKEKSDMLAAEQKREEARKFRCTKDHCPLGVMDHVAVVNGGKIHKMEQLLESGHGAAKSQALAMIQELQSKIKNDFNQVTGFARHQEHVLDEKKVKHDTAYMLGRKVALSEAGDTANGLLVNMPFRSHSTHASRLPLCADRRKSPP